MHILVVWAFEMAGVEGRCSCARLDQACRAGIKKYPKCVLPRRKLKMRTPKGAGSTLLGVWALKVPKRVLSSRKLTPKKEQLGVHILEVSRLEGPKMRLSKRFGL